MAFPQSFPETISAAYFIANTPFFLYKYLRETSFVKDILASYSTDDLVNEFESRASKEISSSNQLAELYAILAAITYKNDGRSHAFLTKCKEIKYEWFSKFAEYYFLNLKTRYSFININTEQPIANFIYNSTNESKINFQKISQ